MDIRSLSKDVFKNINILSETKPDFVKIHFKSKEIEKIYLDKGGIKTGGSVGFDCVAVEDYKLKKGEFALINLGIVVKVASPFYIELYPRSSTFKKYKIIQTNSVGIIDRDYCGPEDVIRMPVLAMEDTEIKKGTPIAQLVLRKQYEFGEIEIFDPEDPSRGGFGSTDK